MWNTIYVYGDHAYSRRQALEENEHVSADEAESLRSLGLRPRFVFRVESDSFEGLTTDPVQVQRWVRRYPDAEVTVIPIM